MASPLYFDDQVGEVARRSSHRSFLHDYPECGDAWGPTGFEFGVELDILVLMNGMLRVPMAS